jgi:putative CocE/NonD family hydrolase
MTASDRASSVQPFEVVIESDVMVTMRDGVRLATDIHRPARDGRALEGPFPVVLERTPYGKGMPSRAEIDRDGDGKPMSRAEVAASFVRHGYVVVYQDCRGRYGSEGEFVKYLSEGQDGVDTIGWIRQQPWCDGRIAMMGLSYAAHTQVAPACLAPEGLAALVVDCGGFSNAYRSGIRQGGALEMKQWTWAYTQAKESVAAERDPLVRKALEAEDIRAWFAAMPWKPGHSPLRWAPEYEDYVFDQWRHGDFGPFWRQLGIYAEGYYDEFADVPQVHMSSWYDAYVKTATDNFVALKARKKSPVRLIMGPWLHGDRNVPYSGDVDFGPAATFDGHIDVNWRTFRRRWYDHWIMGEANGVDAEPTVRLFLMGGGSGRRNPEGRLDHGGRWIAADDWPLPATHFTSYYLHPDGLLSPEPPAADARPLSYNYDPANPVPTIGGQLTSGRPVFSGGAFDQREDPRFFGCTRPGLPLSARHDVLVFETPPLAEDMAVIGPIKVHLHVSSDCPDTDFTAKLVVIYPPSEDYPRGFAMNLTDGILRCRYRESWEAPSFMEPGRIYAITIEPFATCNLFKAGQRIRLDISSSNFPKFDVNPNTGEPEGEARLKRVAVNTVHIDRAHASHIVLPIMPLRELRSL